MGPVGARSFNTSYIGGSPEQFPDRYRVVSAVEHIRSDSVPTLIAAGDHDHLVPFAGHLDAAARLTAAGVPHVLLDVPFGEHGYDAAWGGIGSQVTRHVVAQFLEKFSPATVDD
jgi:acetyl esterase/lipase